MGAVTASISLISAFLPLGVCERQQGGTGHLLLLLSVGLEVTDPQGILGAMASDV